MRLHGAIEHGAFGLAAAIGGGARGGARSSCGGHGHPDRGIGIDNCIDIQLLGANRSDWRPKITKGLHILSPRWSKGSSNKEEQQLVLLTDQGSA